MTLLRDLRAAYSRLFPGRRHGVIVASLVAVIATVPVAEMAVAKLFSDMVVQGPELVAEGTTAVTVAVVVFFVAFVVARGLHHAARAYRVRAIGRALTTGGSAAPSRRSWEWAQAFELTGVLSVLVQTAVFAAFFVVLDVVVGLVSLVVSAAVVLAVSALYGRQLEVQRSFVTPGKRPTLDSIAARVGTRVIEGERGAVVASVAMVAVLGLLLWRVLAGAIDTADAIVLFLGMRLLYGQLGTLSAGVMRFARAQAKMESP